MQISYELTDTFGGEANYSWVRRGVVEMKESVSDLAIVRKIKSEIGWSGYKCSREDYGDVIALRPRGICQVLFITFD
jgi:hypothetical protein